MYKRLRESQSWSHALRASSLRAAEEDEEDDTQHDQVSENGTH